MEEEGHRNIQGPNPNRPCDTCGDARNASLLETCFICKVSKEHIYCMGFGRKMPERPEKWSCAACSKSEIMTSVQLPRKTSENLQTKLGSRLISAARSSRSSRDYIKEVQTGKVKYLDVADAVKLSSGEAAATARMGSQTGSSRNLNHITSRKYPASVSEASKRFSTSPLPSQHASPPGYFSFSVPTRGQPSTKHPQVIKSSLHSHAGKPKIRDSDAESETLKRFSTSTLPSQHTSPPGYFSFSVPTRGQPRITQPQVIKTSLHSHAGKPKIRDSDAETQHFPSNWSRPIESVAKDKHKVTELLRKNKPGTEVVKPPVKKHVLWEEEFHASPPPAKPVGSSKHVNSPSQEFVLREEEPFHVSLPPAKPVGSSKHVESPVGEFDLPEQESVHVSSPPAKEVECSKDGSSSKEYEMFEKGLPDHLSISATWKGSFEIMGTTLMDGSYEGLQAHPPRKVHVKAAKVFKEIPRLLQFKLHPRSDVCVENFNRLCPTKDDIALYFLPGDDERSTKNYHILSDFIVSRDLTMRSCLNDVELLIFTSKKLPADCQKINSKFYLCGVFRSVKKHRPSPEPSAKSLPNNYDSDVDQPKHRPSSKPSEMRQHKGKNYSQCNNYDSDADRVKHHPSSKASEKRQQEDKDYSPCNNYDSNADRVKHHPSTKPSEKCQHRDKDYSPCNNNDFDADREKHHPSTKPSEKSRLKDKNHDTDVDILSIIRRDSMGTDMDIDMVGGKDVGKTDEVVLKSNCVEKRVQFDVESTKKVCSNVINASKRSDNSAKQPISTIKKEQPQCDAPPGFASSATADAAILEPPGFSRPTTADAAILKPPPGFSRPATADAAILEPPPGFSRPATADAAILEPPPGFSRPTTADAAVLEPPPGFSRPTTADAAMSETPPAFSRQAIQAALLEPPFGFTKPANDLSSLKRKRISLDASTSDYFQVSPVQRQKHIQVSDSQEFYSQNHQQVIDHCLETQSASIDHKPAAEKEKSSECKIDGSPSRINGILNKVPKKEDDCSDSLMLTLRFDDEVGGWQAH